MKVEWKEWRKEQLVHELACSFAQHFIALVCQAVVLRSSAKHFHSA